MKPENVDPMSLEKHLRRLCTAIGVRVAGTMGEEAAAAYIEETFKKAGAEVSVETFPIRSRWVEDQLLEVRIGGIWHTFPCSLFSSSPGTDGRTIEAPLAFFEAPTEYARPDLKHFEGKAVVHLGCHIESRRAYRKLIEANPAFLMLVDVRYPGDVPLADGLFPSYTKAIGAVPTVNVAYQHAWKWRTQGADAARLRVTGGMREAGSQNVIAELPGDEAESVLFVGAHHDTQADSVGADDNATGVAAVLELARVLAPLRRRRTIRLISFGAEEQLSVGSAQYVRRHRSEVQERGALILNFDSFGSPLGWNEFVCNGPKELQKFLVDTFKKHDLYCRITSEAMPYADHFPFVAAGIPGITVFRANCAAGRFFHHRPDDDLTRVSPETMASILNPAAEFLAELASCSSLPFPPEVPQEQTQKIQQFWEDLFGGWEPL